MTRCRISRTSSPLPASRRSRALAVPSALLAGAVLLAAAPTARAVPTATFDVTSFKALDKGTPLGTLISSKGEVVPGLGLSRVKGVKGVMVWSRVRAPDGTVYFGTGEDGAILAVRNNRLRKVAQLKALLVTALARGPGGKLLAGTLPDAKIVEVDPRTGKWRQLAKLPALHVWSLLYDKARGRIFAASGVPGKVFVLPAAGGKPRVYFDPGEKHLLCLARDLRGHLLTGGNDKAILYRVSGPNRATAVHDFAGNELRRVVVGRDGTIYAAVNAFRVRTGGLPRFDRPTKGKSGTPIKAKRGKKRPKYRARELRPGAKAGKGALYRISPAGRVEQLLSLASGYFTDVAEDRLGLIWAADGAHGKVFLARPDRTVMTAFDLEERQVLALAVAGPQMYLGTGDGGNVYRISARRGAKAPAYRSQVFDAKYVARFGAAHYRATGAVRLLSRSGNTAKPDVTWSPWQAATAKGAGRAKLASPAARYLQLKVVWQGAKGALRHFKVYYRPQNQRARVKELKIKRGSKPGKPRLPQLKLKWKVDNPDKDPLVYRLYYREELGASWRQIGTKPTSKAAFTWNTEGVADDTYRIKIVVSDEKANGPAETLTDAFISPPVLVDNRKPDVVGLTVRYPWATGIARDATSTVDGIEYAIDGGPWRLISVVDGIYDSTAEAFRIALPADLARGGHTLAVRARDAGGNLGVRQVRFVR